MPRDILKMSRNKSVKSEYFVLLPIDICCSLPSFAAIVLKTENDGKFVTVKCSCINYGATLRKRTQIKKKKGFHSCFVEMFEGI